MRHNVFPFGHCDGDLQFSGGVFKESRRCFLLWSWQGLLQTVSLFFLGMSCAGLRKAQCRCRFRCRFSLTSVVHLCQRDRQAQREGNQKQRTWRGRGHSLFQRRERAVHGNIRCWWQMVRRNAVSSVRAAVIVTTSAVVSQRTTISPHRFVTNPDLELFFLRRATLRSLRGDQYHRSSVVLRFKDADDYPFFARNLGKFHHRAVVHLCHKPVTASSAAMRSRAWPEGRWRSLFAP